MSYIGPAFETGTYQKDLVSNAVAGDLIISYVSVSNYLLRDGQTVFDPKDVILPAGWKMLDWTVIRSGGDPRRISGILCQAATLLTADSPRTNLTARSALPYYPLDQEPGSAQVALTVPYDWGYLAGHVGFLYRGEKTPLDFVASASEGHVLSLSPGSTLVWATQPDKAGAGTRWMTSDSESAVNTVPHPYGESVYRFVSGGGPLYAWTSYWTGTSSTKYFSDSSSFTAYSARLSSQLIPLKPLVLTPSTGVLLDVEQQGLSVSWEHRAGMTGPQQGWALRVTTSGIGVRYWNAATGTLGTSPVINPGTLHTATLPAAAFPNGTNRQHLISVATCWTNQLLSEWSTDVTVTGTPAPTARAAFIGADVAGTLASLRPSVSVHGIPSNETLSLIGWKASLVNVAMGTVLTEDQGTFQSPPPPGLTEWSARWEPGVEVENGARVQVVVQVQQSGGAWSAPVTADAVLDVDVPGAPILTVTTSTHEVSGAPASQVRVEFVPDDVDQWASPAPMLQARQGHSSHVIEGHLYVVGGSTDKVERLDLSTGAWEECAPLPGGVRTEHVSVVLNGYIYVLGGIVSLSPSATCYRYDPAANQWVQVASLPGSRYAHAASVDGAGRILVTGGRAGVTYLDSAARYDPVANTWKSYTLGAPRAYHSQTTEADGRVILAGGFNGTAVLSTTVRFDPMTESFTAGPSLPDARYRNTATVLDGKTYLVGGLKSGAVVDIAVWRIPSGGSAWETVSPLIKGRHRHCSTVDRRGRLVVTGGGQAAERYDPRTDAWTALPPMNQARSDHAAALAPDGRVIVTGGEAGAPVAPTASVESFRGLPDDYPWASRATLVRLERLDLGEWVTVAETMLLPGRVSATLDDYSASAGPLQYRARGEGEAADGSKLIGAWGASTPTVLQVPGGWLMDVLAPETAQQVRITADEALALDTRKVRLAALGRAAELVTTTTGLLASGRTTVRVPDPQTAQALYRLLLSGSVLKLVWSPEADATGESLAVTPGETRWFRAVGEVQIARWVPVENGPWSTRTVSFSWVQQHPPVLKKE